MSTTTEVTQEDLHVLLNAFEKKSYEAGSCEEGTLEAAVTKKCETLFKSDYTIVEFDNTNGILSPRYPARIFIPEYAHGHMMPNLTSNNANTINSTNENGRMTPTLTSNNANTITPDDAIVTRQNSTSSKDLYLGPSCSNGIACSMSTASNGIHAYVTFANSLINNTNSLPSLQYPQHQMPQTSTTSVPTTNGLANTTTNNTIYEDLNDICKARELIPMAKYARCRQRFAVPVLMYRGKYVCRSATISINAETYGRKAYDCAYDYLNGTNYSERANPGVDEENNDNGEDSLMPNGLSGASPFSYDEVIKSDIQLLNTLNITTIVDLMVEKRKIKYFMAVSSSEKADPENHYENFNILSLPYPGCEFFKKFRDNNYMAENLRYNWTLGFNDAPISIPSLNSTYEMNINWNEYKNWDLILLTQNYLKACLKYLQDENAGLLVHCISGWDRTPLFISLLRMSLWADGLIHQSLNPMQMTYLTVAYDWYLFGHQLPDRLKRGEDIMLFCFHVLKYIIDEEFSVIEKRKRTKTSSSSGGSTMVLRTDDEEPREELIDHESNDSFSNVSLGDVSITDNYYATSTPPTTSPSNARTSPNSTSNNVAAVNSITNRSPNPTRSRTSPISVPGASAARQRHESSSSVGSWLFISKTGSVDSMKNGSCMTNFANNSNDVSNNCSNAHSNVSNNIASSSNGALYNETNNSNSRDALPSTNTNTNTSIRKQRLDALRAIFINTYGRTVGLKFKEGTTIASFIGTIADIVYS